MFIQALFGSDKEWLILFMRLVLGVVIFAPGMQKLFGWFGGAGPEGTLQEMKTIGVSSKVIVWLTIIGQSFGSVALLIGFCTRIAAIGIFIIMAGAMTVNIPNGWFMNWTGKQKGEGVEYFVLLLAIDLFIIFKGAGPLAVDNWIARLG